MSLTHGKCWKCKVVWRWSGRPLLRNALCEKCLDPLARTAASLMKHWPVVDGSPFETMRDGTDAEQVQRGAKP